ncbi:hypothetical protein ABTK67_18435, partial [Acinetobacter baumannii]
MRRLGCFGFLLVLGAFGFLCLVAQDWGGRGPAQRNITFDVGDGASLSTISSQLEEQGAIRSAARFRLYAKIFGASTPIKSGEYRIPAHLSAA